MALEPGTIVGVDFRIVSPLSEGGMGAVYVAEQISVGRKRAIKVMHRELLSDAKLRARFVQEAKVGATIDSEHVVEVIAAGVDEKLAIPWLAMELLEGKDLASLIEERGSLPFSDLVEVFDQLCHALGAAHAASVVHRDLKPENIFIARSRRRGLPFFVKVLDFGIAKVVAEARATSAGTAALGTPLYMAPEQTEARGNIAPSADVWALGLIAFRALTGTHFWRSVSGEAPSLSALMREVLIEEIPRPSARVEVAAKLPTGFDAWFARCVARDPQARFPDARAAHEAFVAMAQNAQPATSIIGLALTELAPKRIDVVQTEPQPPLPAGMASPASTAGRDRRSGLPVFPIAIGVVAVTAVVGVSLFFLKRWNDNRTMTTAHVDASSSASVGSPPVSMRPPLENHFIDIAPPAKAIVLGLASDATASSTKGLRPSRKIMAPTIGFSIQQHEVTWSELAPWLTNNPSMSFGSIASADNGALPATGAPWEVAAAYCHSLDAALPTEEQWEFAARGPEKRTYAWGSDPIDLARTHAFAGKDGHATAVMTNDQDVTPSGVHDLMGNAREWTASLWREDANTDESWVQDGPTSARAVRGWPLKMEPPPTFAGFFSEYREWACATGACSPLHADLSTKPPLQPIAVVAEPGPSTPLHDWAASPTFSGVVGSCARVRIDGAQTWKLHAEVTTTTICPTGFAPGPCERDGKKLPYSYNDSDGVVHMTSKPSDPHLTLCNNATLCTGGNLLRHLAVTSSDTAPDILRCVNDHADATLSSASAPATSDVTVRVSAAKTPALLEEIGFRCVRASIVREAAPTPSTSSKPRTAAQEKDLAKKLLERGDYNNAIAAAQRAVALSPADGEAWLLLGGSYDAAGRRNEAQKAYTSCVNQASGFYVSECKTFLKP